MFAKGAICADLLTLKLKNRTTQGKLMSKMIWQQTQLSPCETFHTMGNSPLYSSRFKRVMKYHEPGLAAAEDTSGAFHIDIQGQPAYYRRFMEAFGFYEECAAVRNEEGWFHVTHAGEDCYSARYLWCGNFQEGLCPVKDQTGYYFHINRHGEKAYDAWYAYVGDFKDGAAVVCNTTGLHTHIDYQGQLTHGNWFLGLDIFHKGQARAKDKRGWYHIDKSGQPLYMHRYAQIEPFYNGIAHVEAFSGELLTINTQGEKMALLRPTLQKPWQQLSADMVGFWRTETLAAAVRLQILDSLPGTTEGIAQQTRLPSKHLGRLLRALWELDVVENTEDTWQLTEKGQAFVPHHDSFLAAAAIMWSDVNRQVWGNITQAICQEKKQTHPVFKVTASDEKRVKYHQAIDGYAVEDFSPVLTLIDWQHHQYLIGVGRSAKVLLELLLTTHKHLHALLLGEEYVFQPISINSILTPRYSLKPHRLHHPWPQRADAILLPRVLHYWHDEQVIQILQQAHHALFPQGKIYLLEMLLDEQSPDGGLLDLNMLVESGGQLRTLFQWKMLLAQVSLQVQENINLTYGVNLLILQHQDK